MAGVHEPVRRPAHGRRVGVRRDPTSLGDREAVLADAPLAPNVINPSKPGCLAIGFDATDPDPLPTQQVPADVFVRDGPQTITFSKPRSVAGGGRSISSTVTYEIVFQRTDGAAG